LKSLRIADWSLVITWLLVGALVAAEAAAAAGEPAAARLYLGYWDFSRILNFATAHIRFIKNPSATGGSTIKN
jgi:hypothetical protein